MDQRRIGHPHQSPPPPPQSSSLLGIGDELYELLQGSRTCTQSYTSPTSKCNANPNATSPLQFFDHIPKMEPELGDFMGSSYTWGAPATQVYNVASVDSLSCLGSYTTPNTAHLSTLPDITTQFAYTPTPPPPGASPQIQALRDFMVYGNLTGGTMPNMPTMPTIAPTMPSPSFSSAVSSRATTPVANGGLGFYQLDDVAVDGGLLGPQPKAQDMNLAYRALCGEIYATERSPHRSQFQRENHILAERQRREEMNEKFSALRSMIPKATKKDKASIVGDTIDYVLELEKRLKQLQACKDTASGTGLIFKSLKRKSPYESRGGGEDGTMESPMPGGSSSETTHQGDPGSPSPMHEGRDSAVTSPSDQITEESKLPGKLKGGGLAEVDVQQLGKQAVVKVVCSRRPGHVLRVLNALEECKVEVLQSNVMTVAENSIHFITVQLKEGLSAPTEELVSAVLQAINPTES